MMLIYQRVHVYTDKNLLFSRISKNGFLFIIFFFFDLSNFLFPNNHFQLFQRESVIEFLRVYIIL